MYNGITTPNGIIEGMRYGKITSCKESKVGFGGMVEGLEEECFFEFAGCGVYGVAFGE